MAINAYIEGYGLFSLEGEPQRPHARWRDVSFPGESGIVMLEMAELKGEKTSLVGLADFGTLAARTARESNYRELIYDGALVLISILRQGSGAAPVFESFPNFIIWSATHRRRWESPVAVGGMAGTQERYFLETVFEVQYGLDI